MRVVKAAVGINGQRSTAGRPLAWRQGTENMDVSAVITALILCVVSVTSSDIEKRIINGSPAPAGTHPYQLSLQLAIGGAWYHICGAVLFGPKWVLTAAHCVYGFEAYPYRVVAGAYDITNSANENVQIVNVSRRTINEKYQDVPGWPNDIALLKLAKVIKRTNIIKYAQLPPKLAKFDFTSCTISGWGYVNGTGPSSPILLDANVTAISNDMCLFLYENNFIINSNICILEFYQCPAVDRPRACSGDSGGPLMCGPNQEYVAGLTSFVVRECNPNYPTVYTRVQAFLDWIEKNTK